MKIVWSNFPPQIVICLFILANVTSFMSSTATSNEYSAKDTGCHLEMSSYKAYYGGIKVKIENIQSISLSIDHFARALTTSLSGEDPTFSLIQHEVAPVLFETLTSKIRAQIPKPVQASFIGINGVFLSYFTSGDGIASVYSNATLSSPSYAWYIQPVSGAGRLAGEAQIGDPPAAVMYAEFLRAANVTDGHTSIGRQWCGGSDAEILVIHTVLFEELNGAVSLGFPIEEVMGLVAERLTGGDGGKTMLAPISMISAVRSDHNVNFVFEDAQCVAEEYRRVDPPSSFVTVWNNILKLEVNVSACAYSLVDMLERHSEEMLLLSVAMIVAFFVTGFSNAYYAVRFARREIEFSAQLSKHREAAEEAERRVMHKSAAMATVSHDIRTALSGITGLIGQSYCETVPGSDLETNLRQMDTSIRDLVDLLNDILDTSKIEAGKMELAEAEFDLQSLLEDVVDLYHPVGMKKGVDVMLDPCDGSLYEYAIVRGDHLKLKQVICNLLSNAVKFTTEGHVSLRVWARRHVSEDSTMTNSTMSDSGDEESYDVKQGPNCVEYVFEVNDTGKGIPKDKRKCVFENYVQVKETAAVVGGGTGLGLGIVQTLVRLMGGDIEIADKPVGESGTCFRFNIFLTSCADPLPKEAHSSHPLLARSADHNNRRASLVVLLIQNEGRRRMIQRFLESLGIMVVEAKETKALPSILEEANCNSPVHVPRATIGFVLLIVDASAGEFSELKDCVARSMRELTLKSCCCKVVWLETRKSRNLQSRGSDDGEVITPLAYYVTSKPLHGSRLFEVIRYLPEFKGDKEPEATEEIRARPTRTSKDKGSSEQKASPSPSGPLVGKKVLIAEDNQILMLVASKIVAKMGASVEECHNGQEAVELVRKALKDQLPSRILEPPYDCILMDCQMPVVNGIEATRLIRKEETEYGLHIPIIALTAHSADGENLDPMFEAGMDLYLQKPLQAMRLMEAIKTVERGKGE